MFSISVTSLSGSFAIIFMNDVLTANYYQNAWQLIFDSHIQTHQVELLCPIIFKIFLNCEIKRYQKQNSAPVLCFYCDIQSSQYVVLSDTSRHKHDKLFDVHLSNLPKSFFDMFATTT